VTCSPRRWILKPAESSPCPRGTEQQLRAGNLDWFVNSGVDLMTDTTRKGVGLLTLRYKLVKTRGSALSGTNPGPGTLPLEFGPRAERTLAADKANRDGVVG
jgi:hypothetical protein